MRVLIEFENKPLFFDQPRREIVCVDPARLGEAFDEVTRAVKEGHWVAGFASYEAGLCLEPALGVLAAPSFPLVHFGVFDRPRAPGAMATGSFSVRDRGVNVTREEYGRDIDRIREHIRTGDVYQITYCIKKRFSFSGSAWALYQALKKVQPVPYAAYAEAGGNTVLSLSPEMFLKKRGGAITVKPMKGSWPRGGPVNDLLGGWLLQRDPKNRAENVMIADLLRNDLGRIGRRVRTPALFEVARYRTIYQMTSTVTAAIDPGIALQTVFQAIFPSGSVTGAPKVEAMRIIREIEREPRQIYTGAVGYVSPEGEMFFNVPIRTLLLQSGDGEMGIGGGIVWDSTADGEWAEGQWKAAFLNEVM